MGLVGGQGIRAHGAWGEEMNDKTGFGEEPEAGLFSGLTSSCHHPNLEPWEESGQ